MELNKPIKHHLRGGGSMMLVLRDAGNDEDGCKRCIFNGNRECNWSPMTCTEEDGYYYAAEATMSPGPAVQSDPVEEPQLLTEDPDHGDGPPPAATYKPAHGGYPGTATGNGEQTTFALARTTDPQTSHDAAASVGGGKLIDLILSVMQGEESEGEELEGWTGKELASFTGRPLNSITPRFAQLKRMGLIHATGRRDKQIVWKLGNGVG